MTAKTEKNVPEVVEIKPITFVCKFCGETRPLEDLVIIRRYFPQLTACSNCAKSRPVSDAVETPAVVTPTVETPPEQK